MSDPIGEKLLREVLRGSSGASWWRRCPDECDLAAYADQRLQPEQRSRFEAHLARCSRCSEAVGLVAKVKDTGQKAVVPPALLAKARALGSESRRGMRWWAPVTAAACLTLALVASLRTPEMTVQIRTESVPEQAVPDGPKPVSSPTPLQDSSPPPAAHRTLRNSTSGAQGLQVISPRNGERVPAQKIEVQWTPVPSALFYEVQVLGAEGSLLWQERVESVKALLPANIPLLKEVSSYVLVRAHLADGRIVKSRVVEFKPVTPE